MLNLYREKISYRDGTGHYLSVLVAVAMRERVVGGERRERSEDGNESEKSNERDKQEKQCRFGSAPSRHCFPRSSSGSSFSELRGSGKSFLPLQPELLTHRFSYDPLISQMIGVQTVCYKRSPFSLIKPVSDPFILINKLFNPYIFKLKGMSENK